MTCDRCKRKFPSHVLWHDDEAKTKHCDDCIKVVNRVMSDEEKGCRETFKYTESWTQFTAGTNGYGGPLK